jgi:3-hydroxyisobutyrate dehydrogenase-like beta-hydroxyacid dehydrogenase
MGDDGTRPRVGQIGLGLMGGPIARHLLAAGFELTCYDIDDQVLQSARSSGASAAGGPAEVAERSDVTAVIVPTNQDAHDVCLGEDGLVAGAADGSVIVLLSSLLPGTCAEIRERAAPAGVEVIDAPMTGGIPAAEDGTLTLLVGGDAATLGKARPVLEAFSTSIHHLGDIGSGQVGKTVNNLIHWGEIVVITEALALGAKLGVEVSKLRPALQDASVDSRTLRELETMRFTWHAKDLADALRMGEQVGASMPAAELARERMQEISPERVARLLSDRDWEPPPVG